MKNKTHLKKTFPLLLLFSLYSLIIFGQDSYIRNRWNFKTGYSQYITNRSINNKSIIVGNLRLEANYGITNFIEAGIYIGYSRIESSKINWADTTIMLNKCFTPFYGINCNLHLLPLLVKKDNFRFDLYVSGKLGGLYFVSPLGYYPHGHSAEYGIGGGLSFYLGKHWGFYSEYCFGKYFFKDNSNLRYGLTFKF
jgi:hypothetical protein